MGRDLPRGTSLLSARSRRSSGAKNEKSYRGRDKDRQSHQLPLRKRTIIDGIRWKEAKGTVRIKERKIIVPIYARRRLRRYGLIVHCIPDERRL